MVLISVVFVGPLVVSLLEDSDGHGKFSKAWHLCAAVFVLGGDQITCSCLTAASLTTTSGKDQKSQSIQGKGKDSSVQCLTGAVLLGFRCSCAVDRSGVRHHEHV